MVGALCAAMSAPVPAIPPHRPLRGPALLLLVLTVLALGILFVGMFAGSDPEENFTAWISGLQVATVLETLDDAAEVMAAVLAVAVTVVAIVVELAANRYSHVITQLFLREPVNLVALGLMVITTLQCLWLAMATDGIEAQPLAASPLAALTLALVTLSLLVLVPYIYFVFGFLSPVNIIQRICRDAYRLVLRVRPGNVERSQEQVEEAIDQLQDVARGAIARGDRSIAMAAIDALAALLADYQQTRERLPPRWFQVTGGITRDPDFLALGPETVDEVERHGTWLERKILRRYLSLLGQSAGPAGDAANLVGIHTKEFACRFGGSRPPLLELCLYTFNSYLRVTITAGNPRTAYFLMNQYRLIGEHFLRAGYPDTAVAVAGYLREYGQIAHKAGISFLLESAAHDVMDLTEAALQSAPDAVDPLVDCLLELDQQIREDSHEESLLGVRRSQIRLGARLLQLGHRARAERVAADLAGERAERLERLHRALLVEERAQYWELTDRGVNFTYLPPELRQYLAPLFDLIDASRIARST
jgi:hypothetical protein